MSSIQYAFDIKKIWNYPPAMIKQKPKATGVPLESTRIITPMSGALIAKIDKEWHKREMPSRSATIRKLIEEALAK